jgi:methylphosphotriester-DNA--protein-cysteine methyltransferase
MAGRNLGEAFVQISPDLSGFGPQLQSGIDSAMAKAVGEVEQATQEIEGAFRETAQMAEQALGQVDGDGFQKVRASASSAGEAVESQLREAAISGDRALSDVDGDGFREAKQEADKAGRQIGDSLEEGARQGDRALSNLAKSAGFAALTAGLVRFAKGAVDAFADLGETVSKATVIFGENVDQIVRYGDEASQALGQSKQAAIAAAADFAIFGKAAGLSGQELASFSTELTTLASDLASFNNTTPEEAIVALGAALRGESEPIRRYGVLLNEATLQQRALKMGLTDSLEPLTQQQRVLAAQAEIFAQTSLAQGDFARTSDSLANQQKILAAEFKDLQAQIGEGLAPIFRTLVGIAGSAIDAFGALPDGIQSAVAVAAISIGVFGAASNALQSLGLAAKTANIYIAAIGAALALGIGAYTAFTRDAKQAEERQQALNKALVEAGDPASTLVAKVQELVTQYQNLNPATEEATTGIEEFAGAQGFVQSQLIDSLGQFNDLGVTVEDLTNALSGGINAFDDAARAVGRLSDLQQSTTQNITQINAALRNTELLGTPVGDSLMRIADSGELTKLQFQRLLMSLDETADAFDDQREANNAAAEAFIRSQDGATGLSQILGAELFQSILDTSLATAEIVGRSDAYSYALENLQAAADEATQAEQARFAEMSLAAQAAEDAKAAQETYNGELQTARERLNDAEDALRGVADAQYELADALLGSINSEINYRNQIDRTIEAIQDYTKAEDDSKTVIDEKDAAMREATTQILRQAEASVQAAIDSGKLTDAQIAAGEGQRMLADELRTVAALLGPNDPLRKELEGYANQLETQIPDEVETKIVAEVDDAKQALGGLVLEAEDAGLETGVAFAEGVQLGIQRYQTVINGQVETLIEEARFAARRAAEIGSPSMLFARDVGEPIVDGIVMGIESTAGNARSAMSALSLDLADAATTIVQDLNVTIADLVKQAEGAFSETKDLIGERRDQEAQARRVKDAEDRVAKAQEEVTKALKESGSNSEAYTKAQRNLEQAQLALEEANFRLLESSYALIEQGPEGVASFESIAKAAGLERSEIERLVQQYIRLIELRKEAAKEEAAGDAVDQVERLLKLREQLDQAIKGIQEQLKKLGGRQDAALERQIANQIVDTSKIFAEAEGATPGTRAFYQKQLDAIQFLAGGRANLLDDLANIIAALNTAIRGGFANGGILSQPTIGLIGEAGPEAIIPITRPGRALEIMAQSGLLGLAQTAGSSGPALQIQNATFQDATDADLVAQRVNAAYRSRILIS